MIPFRYIATSILMFFMVLMAFVVYVAYTKKNSGVTGIDMSQVQKLREEGRA